MTMRNRIEALERWRPPVDHDVERWLEAQLASETPHPRLAEFRAAAGRAQACPWWRLESLSDADLAALEALLVAVG